VTMKTLVAIAALIVLMIGSGLVAKAPGASTPRMAVVESMDGQSDQMPVYIHFTDDWR
jgi:hypothetical protein